MNSHVVVATRNRAQALEQLLTALAAQTCTPASVTIVGVSEADVAGVASHVFGQRTRLDVLLAPAPGLCAQRNHGVRHVRAACRRADERFFVAFFDDDYRPANDWLERCRATFVAHPDVAGVTGHVLADGVHGSSVTEEEALAYINRELPARAHWAAGAASRELSSLYGCNMAFRDVVIESCSFDENLPLYGWQEDRDFTARARSFGKMIYTPECRGVHLGTRSGRVSGVRFGYSQIANPLYLWRKGTMESTTCLRFVARHLVANSVRTLQRNELNDYSGRLLGNALALRDMVRGACHPTKILSLQ